MRQLITRLRSLLRRPSPTNHQSEVVADERPKLPVADQPGVAASALVSKLLVRHGLDYQPGHSYSLDEVLALTEGLRGVNEQLREGDEKSPPNHPAALQVIEIALAVYRETGHIRQIVASNDPLSPEESALVAGFADSLGRAGGLYRRLGDRERMLERYREGASFEGVPNRYGITSSYNLVNVINARLEVGDTTVSELRNEISQAAQLIERRTKSDPKAWDWADLAQCRLLLGDLDSAKLAYREYVKVANAEMIKSTMRVLGSLEEKLGARQEIVAKTLGEGVGVLRTAAAEANIAI